MPDSLRDLPHHCIVDYLRDTGSPEDRTRIQTLRASDPGAELFLNIIDESRHQATIGSHASSKQTISINFTQMDELLLRIFSGNATSEDSQRFIDALLFAPVFYQRLLAKLPLVTPGLVMAETPEMAGIEMLPDEQILSERIVKKRPSNGESGALALVAADLKDGVVEWWSWLVAHPAIATAGAAILVMIVLMPAAVNMFGADPFAKYVYDDKIPYEYRAVIFRTPSEENGPVSDFKKFHRQFQMAMGDYMVRHYEQAIVRLENLLPLVRRLTAEGNSPEAAQNFRDYYFYLGVSHLAMARSRNSEMTSETRETHGHRAVEHLVQGRTFAERMQLNQLDRETYFLGVAYGFTGQNELGEQELSRIDTESEFNDDAISLMRVWSEADPVANSTND